MTGERLIAGSAAAAVVVGGAGVGYMVGEHLNDRPETDLAPAVAELTAAQDAYLRGAALAGPCLDIILPQIPKGTIKLEQRSIPDEDRTQSISEAMEELLQSTCPESDNAPRPTPDRILKARAAADNYRKIGEAKAKVGQIEDDSDYSLANKAVALTAGGLALGMAGAFARKARRRHRTRSSQSASAPPSGSY